MSRTPLFRFLRRSLALARSSLHCEQSPAELIEQARQRREWSRREILSAAASTAAVLVYSGCAPTRIVTPRGRQESVAIFGAGIAGLTAAYRLKQAGIAVRVFEAGSRAGGRIFSLRDHFADGQVAELGGELIDTNHTAIHALAREFGIRLDDFFADDPSLERDVWFFGGQRRTEKEVVEAFRPIAARIEKDLATIGREGEVTYRSPNRAQRLDRMSVAEWLDSAGATGWVHDLLNVGYTTEYGLEIGRQSALNLLLLIDPDSDTFKIYGESDERFHVRGGNDAIPGALASRLENEIETGAALEAITERPDGSFACSIRGAGSRTIAADHVVLAIPFTLLRSVKLDVELPPAKRRAIEELGYGTNAKLMAGFSERVWRTKHGSNGSVLTDLPFQATWETSRMQPGASGILTNFTGGNHGAELGSGSAAEQAERFVGHLERIYPGAAGKRAGMKEARFHWPSHPFTKGSYACYLVGQWTSLRGAEGERVGRLHFAGEHCSLAAQGFMEGGCETGEAVAREILSDLGIRRPVAA